MSDEHTKEVPAPAFAEEASPRPEPVPVEEEKKEEAPKRIFVTAEERLTVQNLQLKSQQLNERANSLRIMLDNLGFQERDAQNAYMAYLKTLEEKYGVGMVGMDILATGELISAAGRRVG